MALARTLHRMFNGARYIVAINTKNTRLISMTRPTLQQTESESNATQEPVTGEIQESADEALSDEAQAPEQEATGRKRLIPIIAAETSMRYMESEAYKKTYGDLPVWTHYRRNFKGAYSLKTRKMCIRGGMIATGSPCPICRDEYLVIDYKNISLLEQFISPYTGEILDSLKTGICRKQQQRVRIEVQKAQDYGYIEAPLPEISYNYDDYLEDPTAPSSPAS